MKTDNELIAEFMDLVRKEANATYNKAQYYLPENDKRYRGRFVGYYDSLQYHESWDWLMPVVEKIRKYVIENEPFGNEYYQAINNALIEVDIHDCYVEVVEFIKWHNSQVTSSPKE
jgi:hypothetical protein